MNPVSPKRIALTTDSGISIWVSGCYVVAITREMFFAKRFETDAGREKVAKKIEQGEPVKLAMGLLTKSISPDAVRNVCLVPSFGALVVRGGRLKEPIRLEFPDDETSEEIFESLRKSCQPAAEVSSGKASVNDVPLDPQLAGTFIFGLLGIACLLAGALETGPIQGGGQFQILGKLGQWIGPIPILILGGILLAIAVFFTISWWRDLPEKRFFETR